MLLSVHARKLNQKLVNIYSLKNSSKCYKRTCKSVATNETGIVITAITKIAITAANVTVCLGSKQNSTIVSKNNNNLLATAIVI